MYSAIARSTFHLADQRLYHRYHLVIHVKAAGEEPLRLRENGRDLPRLDVERQQKVANRSDRVALLQRNVDGVRALGVHPQHDQARVGAMEQRGPALG